MNQKRRRGKNLPPLHESFLFSRHRETPAGFSVVAQKDWASNYEHVGISCVPKIDRAMVKIRF